MSKGLPGRSAGSIERRRERVVMWPELFGAFWGLVVLTVMAVVLAYIVLILLKYRVEEIEQGRRPERMWGPVMGVNLGACCLHTVVGILVALGHY